MTAAEQNPPLTLPLFFRQLVPLDAERHGELCIDRGGDFGHAAQANAVPLALSEFTTAAADYPIVFGAPGRSMALAVLGFRDRENLFVGPDGAWRSGAYIPAYVRNYPFAFFEQPDGTRLVLGVDPEAPCLKEGAAGVPLFVECKPAPVLAQALEFCKALHQSLKATGAFCAALDEAGLLVENQAVINFSGGATASLGGFRIVDAAKLDALDNARFLDWRKRGWLAAIYAHLHSLPRWARIVDFGAERMRQTQ